MMNTKLLQRFRKTGQLCLVETSEAKVEEERRVRKAGKGTQGKNGDSAERDARQEW